MKKFFYILLLATAVASCGTGHVTCDAYGSNDIEIDLDQS
jgi:hypothetical protein